METRRHPILMAIAIAALTCTCVEAFSIQRRSADVTSPESQLTDALKVIQREKRRALFDGMDNRRWDNNDDDDEYLGGWDRTYPLSVPKYNSYPIEQLSDLFAPQNNEISDEDYPEISKEDIQNFLSTMSDNDSAESKMEDKDLEVGKDELQSLFTDSPGDKEKRGTGEEAMLTEALLGPVGKRKEKDGNTDPTGIINNAESIKLDDLSTDQINALIKTVEDEVNQQVTSEQHGGDEHDNDDVVNEESMQVSDDEINDIFNDDDDEQTDTNVVESTTAVSMATPADDENKEWLMAQYVNAMSDVNGGAITRKKKRSEGADWRSQASLGSALVDTPADLALELAIAREDIKVLKTFLDKEDAENAHLSHALSLATKSQMEHTDKYVAEEIDYIKKAIQDEMDIQEVKDVIHIASSLDGTAEGGIRTPVDLVGIPDAFREEKRGEPDMDFVDEVDLPDQDEDMDDDVASDVDIGYGGDDGDLVRALLSRKLEKLMRKAQKDYFRENTVGELSDEPIATAVDDVNNDDDSYLNPLMREIYQKYQVPNPLKKRGYPPQGDPEPAEGEDTPMDLSTLEHALLESLADKSVDDDGVCPAVEGLSSGCAFITDLGLDLDEEALELCTRHEMCYICGATLDLSPDECDRGYLEAAANVCASKNSCDHDASRLFILMLRYHDYQQAAPPQCSEPCAEDFISGGLLNK